VNSIFALKGDPKAFRFKWRGYDREQVDEFLRQTAADRQRLQEGLAQLEAYMASHARQTSHAALEVAEREAHDIRARAQEQAERHLREAAKRAEALVSERLEENRLEINRLVTLRREVASCLETSIGALRTATDLLALTETPAEAAPVPVLARPSAASTRLAICCQWILKQRAAALAASAVVVCVLLAVLMLGVGGGDVPSAAVDVPAQQASAAPAVVSAPPADRPSTPLPEPINGLVLTLTARRSSWISTSIDGGHRLDRLLKPDETIMLRANNEAVLRAGDAGALSVLINSRVAKPLGTDGEVVTARITSGNYLSFLAADGNP
jgi:DivIVA domain-containing protein